MVLNPRQITGDYQPVITATDSQEWESSRCRCKQDRAARMTGLSISLGSGTPSIPNLETSTITRIRITGTFHGFSRFIRYYKIIHQLHLGIVATLHLLDITRSMLGNFCHFRLRLSPWIVGLLLPVATSRLQNTGDLKLLMQSISTLK